MDDAMNRSAAAEAIKRDQARHTFRFAVAFIAVAIGLTVYDRAELVDLVRGPRAVPADRVATVGLFADEGRLLAIAPDELVGTGAGREKKNVLIVGIVPFQFTSKEGDLALARVGKTVFGVMVRKNADLSKLAGKTLQGAVQPWPKGLERPREISPWILDMTERPSWGPFVFGAIFVLLAAAAAWQSRKEMAG